MPGSEAADRVSIDGRQLQVRRDGADWKLALGNHVLANFGPNQGDAQLGLQAPHLAADRAVGDQQLLRGERHRA